MTRFTLSPDRPVAFPGNAGVIISIAVHRQIQPFPEYQQLLTAFEDWLNTDIQANPAPYEVDIAGLASLRPDVLRLWQALRQDTPLFASDDLPAFTACLVSVGVDHFPDALMPQVEAAAAAVRERVV